MAGSGRRSCAACGSSRRKTLKLKRLVADLSLDKSMLQDVLAKKV